MPVAHSQTDGPRLRGKPQVISPPRRGIHETHRIRVSARIYIPRESPLFPSFLPPGGSARADLGWLRKTGNLAAWRGLVGQFFGPGAAVYYSLVHQGNGASKVFGEFVLLRIATGKWDSKAKGREEAGI